MTAKEIEENRKKIHEILDIVLDTNGLEGRTTKTTGPLPAVFFRFLGHTGVMDVSIFENGWAIDNEPTTIGFNTAAPINDRDIQAMRLKCQDALYGKYGVESAELRRNQIMNEISARKEELEELEYYIQEQRQKLKR